MKANIIAPEIKGTIDGYFYVANNLNIEIEITPRPPTSKPIPVPIRKPVKRRSPGLDYLIGSALIAGAGVLIAATIVEDVLTLGVGVADDIPSFAAAAAMFTSGTLLFKRVESGTPIHIEGHGVAPDTL